MISSKEPSSSSVQAVISRLSGKVPRSTTSVDQYAATLARWFGVANGDIDTLFPLVNRFPTSDLGFMA